MKTYKVINNIMGWLMFAVAAFTYCSTVEPTASFWDCPEFICAASRLEVGHSPGAPFFMLVGNVFSQFASDSSQVARMINTMSALLSAGCILFLFWTITHLAKALIIKEGDTPSTPQTIAIMASGVCGSLIYTWSDTFWFSAVEGEVYAFSSFFTALVFWLILKWEDEADNPRSDRWIVFICYLIGLSIGVHLLNLLCIPAIVLVYYYKKTSHVTVKGTVAALLVSFMLVAIVLYGIVPGILIVAGWFELFFTNTLGMPYNTGVWVFIAILTSSLIAGIYFSGHTDKKKVMRFFTPRFLHTTLLSIAMMLIGYSSYTVIVIRSLANTPMDQNSPEDVFTLREYIGREQYGDKPLLWGPTYASSPNIVEKYGQLKYETINRRPVYRKKVKASDDEKDEYVVVREDFDLAYPADQCMLFPRIYDERHKADYEQWLGEVHKKNVDYVIPTVGTRQASIPTQADNLRFLFSYQINFMYWRYFLWNFAGRQNDRHSTGVREHGNWITGFSFIDDAMLGKQELLPSELKDNKGHNVFYCIPLIIGLIGLMWQAFGCGRKGIQQFWVVFFLFFMTGIAIVLYLNQTPCEPRERDYAYVGSFYAFAIWCGLGIPAIFSWLKTRMTSKLIPALVTIVPALAIPLQMVSQTWDDHDRSDRYACRDFGLNYLETVPHDGIVFTFADNDTFPLWYNQDVEGKRTDVRVCNLSYLQTSWYIDQMKRPAYSSSPLPVTWNARQYAEGQHERVEVNPTIYLGDTAITVKQLVEKMYDEEPETARRIWGDEPFEYQNAIRKFLLKEDIPTEYRTFVDNLPSCVPSDTLYIKVDKAAVRHSGMMIPEGMDIPDHMDISFKGQGSVLKSYLMMLDIIASVNFSRPIYVASTVGPSQYGNLYTHFVQEGINWRITPFTFEANDRYARNVPIDTERMYDNLMNRYHYGNLSQRGIYIDEQIYKMSIGHRRQFASLAMAFATKGDTTRAKAVLDKCARELPSYNLPYAVYDGSLELVTAYRLIGDTTNCKAIIQQLECRSREYLAWYLSLPQSQQTIRKNDIEYELQTIHWIEEIKNSSKE